ncbi:right-handed parallel beta-helix repeat-containing protein [Rahnella aceris]
MTQRYNTDNPVPSNAMMDLNDNAIVLDEFVNNASGNTITRKGVIVPVLQERVNSRIDGLMEDAIDAVSSAQNSALSAQAAAAEAQSISDGGATFYITPSDPDGTIAGLSATPSGNSFRVAQGIGSELGFAYFLNNDGVAVPVATTPSGEISKLVNSSTDANLIVIKDVDGSAVEVKDDFGGVSIPGIPATVQEVFQQIQKNAGPYLNILTDAENQAFESVCDFGSMRIPGMPDGIAEMIQITKKRLEKLYKFRRVIDAREFGLNAKTGEDSHRAIQAGYDALSSRGGGFLYIPEGYFKLARPIIPRPNVSLVGAGQNATVLLPFGYLAAITYQGAETYIENLQFSDFTIDGENQQLHPVNGYIPDIKGIYLQYYRNTIFDRLTIRNTGATGLGVDMPDRVSMTRCLVENCGRLATVGALGASGFGLGTSFLSSEPLFASQLIGRNNKNFGIFFEPQRGTGTAQDAIVTDSTFYGNYAGLADCGIEGLIATNLNLRGNQYGFVAEPGTNNGGNPGFRGKINNCIIKGNSLHGMYFNTGKGDTIVGEYSITGTHISENGEDGINIRYATEVTNSGLRVSDCDINDNGRHGVNFEAGPVVDADIINNRIRNNGKLAAGNGINSNRSMSKCRIAFNSIRDTQPTPTQQYPVSISGSMTDTDVSFNHCVGNVQNTLNLTGTQTRVTTINNPGIA